MALEKSNDEYLKYKAALKLIEKEKSLKELENDIIMLKKQLPGGAKPNKAIKKCLLHNKTVRRKPEEACAES